MPCAYFDAVNIINICYKNIRYIIFLFRLEISERMTLVAKQCKIYAIHFLYDVCGNVQLVH